ncbi:MAG: hypothetical protein ACE5D8_10735, partial [Fidelibacterota bacterium]
MKNIEKTILILTTCGGLIFAINNPGLTPPDTPTIYATAEHGQVIVSWGNEALESIDAYTGYSDFEGYRVYRSLDGGQTWGGADDRLYDFDGNFIGWKPYAQFDLNADEDADHCIYTYLSCGTGPKREISIEGPDPYNARFNLGTNTGLANGFIDENVFDGIEYTYCVTAYDIGLRTYTVEFTDADGDGIFTADTTWSPTNPDHFVIRDTLDDGSVIETGFRSLESPLGTSAADRNFITVVPGYTASNITFPDRNEVTSFLRPDPANIGNGDISYFIVDYDNLSSGILKFEVNAWPGESPVENMAMEDPRIYVYDVSDTINQTPLNVVEYDTAGLSAARKDSLLAMPGAVMSGSVIEVPDYVASFIPTNGNQNLWSEVFEGIRVKYENLPQSIIDLPEDFTPIYELEWHADSSVIKAVSIVLNYQSSNAYTLKPNFDYRIDFSETVLDTPTATVPPAGCIGHGMFKAELPFRVTNITSGRKVDVSHIDKGVNGSPDPLNPDPGYVDCTWTQNELIQFERDSILVDTTLETKKTYTINIYFNTAEAYPGLDTVWVEGISYPEGSRVFHEGMVWRASRDILESVEPIAFIDDNNDGTNENPWKLNYPWHDGDFVIIRTKKFFVDGDSWVADMALLGKSQAVTEENLKEISVVPNPYIVHSKFNETSTSRKLRFTHLPQQCRIQIFTISGERVYSFDHNDQYDGNAWWDLRTENNQEVAP